MKSFVHGFTTPAKTAFRFPRIARAQLQRHFRHEQTPLMPLKTVGSLPQQRIVTAHRVFHDPAILEWRPRNLYAASILPFPAILAKINSRVNHLLPLA